MSTAAVRDNWEGRIVDGNFPLLRWVGGSTQSTVFLTELPASAPRKAAIKLIPSGDCDVETVLSAWQSASKLVHPHLLRIFDSGQCELNGAAFLYVVMEYAEQNLAQVLPERSLTETETGEMLFPVLDALAYIHANKFVHGEIKPSNLMVVDEQLKLSSDSIQPPGKPIRRLQELRIYSAPETKAGAIVPASDIWSLGVTVVVALTQCPPVLKESNSPELILPAALAEPFKSIAQECLRQEPAARCKVEFIRTRLENRGPSVRNKGEVDPAKPNKAHVNAVVVAAILLVVVIAVVLMVSPTKRPSQTSAVTQPTPPAASQTSLPAPPETARHVSGPVNGAVVERVMPDISASARRTIQGKIKVSIRVTVDSSGAVSNATFESRGPSQYFANQAMQAVRRWKFTPAQQDGTAVSSKWVLRFGFGRSSTEIAPTETSP